MRQNNLWVERNSDMEIRDCCDDDLPAMLAIYNDVIATSTAIYSDTPVTLEDRTSWWKTRTKQGYPVLVASEPTGVVGFASFGDFRAWPGYRFTVEHSVHVRADCRGRGIGTALVTALLPKASALGKHVMIAGIDADNAASIRMHERLGFVRVAHFRQVGFKFERWLDLVFLQRHIDDPERRIRDAGLARG
jgi:phosphinothricin acetyltransferase